MNVSKLFLILVTGLFTSSYHSQSAVEYLETIGKEFTEIQKNTWDYTRSAAHGKSARKVEKRRKEVVFSNQDALRKITRLKPYNGSSRLRDSAISFLKVNYAVLNEDYAKLVDLEEISEQSYDAMEAYLLAKDRANEKLHLAGAMIDKEYELFASSNNINLIKNDDKVSRNMEIAGRVYRHYNEVYLIFFASYKQEAYMLDAMVKNDVNGIEQNRSALSKKATEGLNKLTEVKPYSGDKSLIIACGQLLNFYKDEAEKHHASTSRFFVTRDNFEKLKNNFTSRPAAQRTQSEIEQYNNSVNEYNKASDEYNKSNNDLNKQRSEYLQQWNNACDKFTDKHVPKR
jgi:hypothetical protein